MIRKKALRQWKTTERRGKSVEERRGLRWIALLNVENSVEGHGNEPVSAILVSAPLASS
jgi:hypothetical protein